MRLEKIKKKECPSCAIDVDETEDVCPFCGYEFPVQKKSTMIAVWAMIILLILWLVL